jgi:hypothetical protein
MDCFASLAMTWNHLYFKALSPVASREPAHFFIIFVDGMFTIFIVRPFTNSSHVLGQMRAMSCV